MRHTLLFTSCLVLLPATALAQEGSETTKIEERIVVTTPGPQRSADELIGNASVINRDEIIRTLAPTLGDTLAGEPGISTTFFGAGASRPVLRGLGSERVQVLTNGLGVIDASSASPDHQVTGDGIDARAIEVLRGPAALAYGGQAIGGVVNVIDGLIAEEIPEKPFNAEGYGAFNSVNEGSEFAGRIEAVAGQFVFNLSASTRDMDDYDIPGFAESSLLRALEEAEHDEEEHEDEDHEEEDHDHEEHQDEEIRDTLENSFVETETYSAGLSWVGERAYFGVAVRQQNSKYGIPGHSHAHEEEHDHDEDEDHDEEEHEEEDHDEDEHDHEEEAVFIDLEQTRIDLRGGVEFDGPVLNALTGALVYSDYTHTEFEGPGEAGTVFESEGVEGRVELDHTLGGFSGALGVQFLDKEFEAVGEEAFLPPSDTESLAVFIYETREWETGFGIEGGARFETIELSADTGASESFDLVSGSFGLHQHFGNGWFAGAQASYSQRAPNEAELFAFGPHIATEQFEVGNINLDVESGLNLEGTLRWKGNDFQIGANIFATSFSDFIFLTPGAIEEDGEFQEEEDGLPVFLFVQDDADFFGGEIYMTRYINGGPLGADWELDASVDYVSAELDNGNNVPFLPPLTFNAGASAAWEVIELGADVIWADEQSDPGEGSLPTDDYFIVNLRGAVNLDAFDIGGEGTQAFIEARNIGDEEVRYATSVLKDTVPAPGRNWRIGVRAKF